jgi:hypothetical protein
VEPPAARLIVVSQAAGTRASVHAGIVAGARRWPEQQVGSAAERQLSLARVTTPDSGSEREPPFCIGNSHSPPVAGAVQIWPFCGSARSVVRAGRRLAGAGRNIHAAGTVTCNEGGLR